MKKLSVLMLAVVLLGTLVASGSESEARDVKANEDEIGRAHV